MNCAEVQDRLSAYFDGELAGDLRAVVGTHVEQCSACREELRAFQALSEMTASVAYRQPPSGRWYDLEAKLDNDDARKPMPTSKQAFRWGFSGRVLVIAATLFLAAGLGVAGYSFWFSAAEHDHLAINFERYLEEFDKDPEKAQRILLASYAGRPTTIQEATATLRYKPAIAKGLPSGCAVSDVYLLDMPCCTCTQAVCQCADGQHIAVFEHDLDQPVWFGDRPAINCLCDGKPTSVVQLGDRLAATWQAGDRYITIVGARDLDDVMRFVAHLSEQEPSG